MNDNRYASRKFVLAAFLLVAAIGLLVAGRIEPSTWSSISTWVLGLYMTGNVGTALAAKVG